MAFMLNGAKIYGGQFNNVGGNFNWMQISCSDDGTDVSLPELNIEAEIKESGTSSGTHLRNPSRILSTRFSPYPLVQRHATMGHRELRGRRLGAPLLPASFLSHLDEDIIVQAERSLVRTSPPPIPYNARPKLHKEHPCMQVFNAVGGHLNHYEINGNFQQTAEATGRLLAFCTQFNGLVGLQILSRYITPGALYNSADRYQHRECHPGTRTAVLRMLDEWSRCPSAQGIFWLFGSAGSGKTTIAHTFAAHCEAEQRLGASFFFSRRDTTRRHAGQLFATLGYQLAYNVPHLKDLVNEAAQRDPLIGAKGMRSQLESLVIWPYQRLTSAQQPRTSVVVIDGLDECSGHGVQSEIIKLISAVILERLPLRILIASRPEVHIQHAFARPPLQGICRRFGLDACIQKLPDVRTFLRHEFRRIHDEHEAMADVPKPWPSDSVLERLAQKSSGQFVYASTIMKFVGDQYARPTERLDILLGSTPVLGDSPFADLDQLYAHILAENPNSASVLRILGVILLSGQFISQALVAVRRIQVVLIVVDDALCYWS
ncbi:hypothetical protein B0H19DRAFT_299265 [Mycena capillaripes]|nr:hypothetical protein B0H19DRAFT_299265 [Mycena capillaripes]